MRTLLNAHSAALEKNPFMEVGVDPCYSNGDYFIYKWNSNHYLHTFKNIVFAERCAPNKEMINNLVNNTMPENRADQYHQFSWPKETIKFGIEHAKKINFKVN